MSFHLVHLVLFRADWALDFGMLQRYEVLVVGAFAILAISTLLLRLEKGRRIDGIL